MRSWSGVQSQASQLWIHSGWSSHALWTSDSRKTAFRELYTPKVTSVGRVRLAHLSVLLSPPLKQLQCAHMCSQGDRLSLLCTSRAVTCVPLTILVQWLIRYIPFGKCQGFHLSPSKSWSYRLIHKWFLTLLAPREMTSKIWLFLFYSLFPMGKMGTFRLNSLSIKIFRLPYDPEIALLAVYPRENGDLHYVKICTWMF